MPPKQANIGYVKSSQSTLGCVDVQVTSIFLWNRLLRLSCHSKFFGNPSESKPAAAQQSKLRFNTKANDTSPASKKDNGTRTTAAKTANVNGGAMNEERSSDEDVKMEDADAHDEPAAASASPVTGEKRQSVDGNAETESDTGPPSKRQRVNRTGTIQQDDLDEDHSDDDSPPIKPSAKSKKPSKLRNSQKEGRNDESKADLSRKKPMKRGSEGLKSEESKKDDVAPEETKADGVEDSKAAAPDEAESDSDPIEAESEDEKPEVAAKSREKVQATLTGKAKDWYPDWKAGDPVPYAALCTTFSKIEMTTKRLEITALCSQFLVQVLRLTPDDFLPTVLLMVNKLAADYAGIELGIGESLIMKAIGETTGRSLQIIKADQQEIGDLGLVAAKSRSNQPTMFKPKPLTVRGVHEGLMSIATTEGQGAQGRKVGGIKKLLSAADAQFAGKGNKGIDITKDKGGPSECKFIIRTLEGKMRLGLAEKTVLVALAHAMVVHEKLIDGKTASSDDLSKGETMLKSVYKYV